MLPFLNQSPILFTGKKIQDFSKTISAKLVLHVVYFEP